MDKKKAEEILIEKGYEDFKWIGGWDIVVRNWVRFKCMYGCSSYGHKGSCPPNTPSVRECKDFFNEYEHIALIRLKKRFSDPTERISWSRKENKRLIELERAFFLNQNYKAFILFMDECRICSECSGSKSDCKSPDQSRPSPEGLSVDVFETVRKAGYDIDVLTDFNKEMSRFAFLLIE